MRVAMMILKRLNLDIDYAENGQEAINKFMHVKYDIILMDCMMPVIDGYQATNKIRKIEEEHNLVRTPIIALTANSTEEDKKKCLDTGMDDFIAKPIKKEFILITTHNCGRNKFYLFNPASKNRINFPLHY